jgi:hypothetical protein
VKTDGAPICLVTRRRMTDAVQCSRCDRVVSGPDGLAGSWYVREGAIVCVTCQRLDDLSAVKSERDDLAGPTVCPGCRRHRHHNELWRGYLLSPAQRERWLLEPTDLSGVIFMCPECEQRVLLDLDVG